MTEWISSVDMENEIFSYDGVLDAAVVGIAHPKWEERPLALVVFRDEAKGRVTADDIKQHIAKTFA